MVFDLEYGQSKFQAFFRYLQQVELDTVFPPVEFTEDERANM